MKINKITDVYNSLTSSKTSEKAKNPVKSQEETVILGNSPDNLGMLDKQMKSLKSASTEQSLEPFKKYELVKPKGQSKIKETLELAGFITFTAGVTVGMAALGAAGRAIGGLPGAVIATAAATGLGAAVGGKEMAILTGVGAATGAAVGGIMGVAAGGLAEEIVLISQNDSR